MTRFVDRVAVVSGAASGIGQALAIALARRGARLAICDVDTDGLAATATAISQLGASVHSKQVDVSDRAAVSAYAAAVFNNFGVINQVYNNAGIACDSTVLANEYTVYERIFSINLWGVIHGTKEFLPYLIDSGEGHLVNISSINGVVAQPGASGYSAAKFAVRGLTESIRAEMIAASYPVTVSVVHPGGVRTNIATSALAHAVDAGMVVTQADRDRVSTFNTRVLKMPAKKAAEIILDGVAADRARILVGSDARVLDAAARLFPERYPQLAAWLQKYLLARREVASTAAVNSWGTS